MFGAQGLLGAQGFRGLVDFFGAHGLPGAQGLLADFFLICFLGAQGLDGAQGLMAEFFSIFSAAESAAMTTGAGEIKEEATSSAESVELS